MRIHINMRQSVDITTLIYVCAVLCNMNVEHCTTAELTCPDISFVQDSALMNCSTSVPYVTLQYSGPGNVNAPQCIAELKYCTPVKGYNASVVNATYSRLRILSIQPYHAGRWTCKNIPDGPSASCNLVTTKTPTCNISSDIDTDALAKYQELSLTVEIRDYFCSAVSNFALQTGNVTTPLPIAEHVTSITSNITAATFNVTNSHLGIVGLIYKCHNKQWDMTCYGVTELNAPTCSITSDKDTDRLTLNKELKLTVDFNAFNCPVASNFTLQTGNVQQLLSVNVVGTVIDRATYTFFLTETHLGRVRLIYQFQQKHKNFTCDGISKLLKKPQTTGIEERGGLNIKMIIGGVVGALMFSIIVVITIVFLVQRKQVSASADTHTHDDLVVTVSQGIRKVAVVYPPSEDAVHQSEDNVEDGSGGSASGNDQQGPGLRINPVYIPTSVGGRIVTTGASAETGVMDGDHLLSETRGEYVALDRNTVQPSNIYEHLRTYEQIDNM